ncbi:MAG: DUF4124 domain-containing protein [Gammaproteobacteria bacterium]|nr:DUF4124 domain-containing protein [Gammaproteobacteria bacterium]
MGLCHARAVTLFQLTVADVGVLHYASGMIRTIALLCLLLPAVASAVICKSVEPDGSVSYTDVPEGECAQRVILPDYSRYEPRPVDYPPGGDGANPQGVAKPFERYRSMQITAPQNNGVERSNEGRVGVVIALDPNLQPGHLVKLTLDGRAVQGGFDGVAIEISGVDRGTHTLRASVVDPAGKQLIAAKPVRFTLRKVGIYDSNAEAPDKPDPSKPDPGYPADPTPPDYGAKPGTGYAPKPGTNYGPAAPPNYKPKPNSGYAPKQ